MQHSKIELYTRNGCVFCDKAKDLLTKHRLLYTLYTIGDNITREQVLDRFPGAESIMLPIVVIDGVNIGGYQQLHSYIAETPYDV
jgi:glutaredoxin 3